MVMPPITKDQATHIVTGEVRQVYKTEPGGYTYYLVELKVEKVERGGGLLAFGSGPRAGRFTYISCFQRSADLPREAVGDPGHQTTPRSGEKIRVWLLETSEGEYKMLWPVGYELLA